MSYLPIFVDVSAQPCLVVGGGAVAVRKARALVERGARVTVVAPSAVRDLAAMAQAGRITWHRRRWRPEDLAGCVLVFSAVDNPQVSRRVAAEARKRGIAVNVADRPELCSFIAPAIVRRGDLQIAISTSAASPALTARIRAALEREFGPEYAAATVVLRAARDFVRRVEARGEERSRRLGALADRDLPAIIRAGDAAALDRALRETIGAGAAALGLDGLALPAGPPAAESRANLE